MPDGELRSGIDGDRRPDTPRSPVRLLIENAQLVRDEPKECNNDHEPVKHHVVDCFDILSIMYDVPVNLMLLRGFEFFIFIDLLSKRVHGHGLQYERSKNKKREAPRSDKLQYLAHVQVSLGRAR